MSGKRVLIVEDDEDIRRNLQDLLESEGYLVDSAEDGAMGLDILRHSQQLPSLILLDLMMPVMDGIRFRSEQVRDPRIASIPVVVMSADGQIQTKMQKINARSYLSKPVDIETVLDAVENNCA